MWRSDTSTYTSKTGRIERCSWSGRLHDVVFVSVLRSRAEHCNALHSPYLIRCHHQPPASPPARCPALPHPPSLPAPLISSGRGLVMHRLPTALVSIPTAPRGDPEKRPANTPSQCSAVPQLGFCSSSQKAHAPSSADARSTLHSSPRTPLTRLPRLPSPPSRRHHLPDPSQQQHHNHHDHRQATNKTRRNDVLERLLGGRDPGCPSCHRESLRRSCGGSDLCSTVADCAPAVPFSPSHAHTPRGLTVSLSVCVVSD